MQAVPLADLSVVGALEVERTPSALSFRRLPAWTRPQVTDPFLATMLSMPAGVRLLLVTDSRSLELELAVTAITIGDLPVPAVVDVTVDGVVVASAAASSWSTVLLDPLTGAAEVVRGEPATLRFDGLPGDLDRRIEVWLPHNARVRVRALRIDDGASVTHLPPTDRRRWVHYGSSISHCLEAPTPTQTWPAICARLAGVELIDLAVAGQCLLDQFVARTIRDLPADLVSIKAGINIGDSMRERTYVSALHGFLDTIRDGHPDAPIVVATPVLCPEHEDRPGPMVLTADGRFRPADRPADVAAAFMTLRRMRELMADAVAARRAAGDHHLHLLDGLQLFGPADATELSDGLHPTPEGYRRIGERFHRLTFTGDGPFAARG